MSVETYKKQIIDLRARLDREKERCYTMEVPKKCAVSSAG